MFEITFEFRLDKLVHAIAFFSDSRVPELTKLKAAKLFYFADKSHLLNHGAPILGDVYWCMDYGPVPSFALNEMGAAIESLEIPALEDSDANMFAKVLRIKKSVFSKHPRFEARQSYDAAVFSQSELQALKETVENYGWRTAGQLVDLTHQEPTWTIPNEDRTPGSRAAIPYDLFFIGAPEHSQRLLAKLKAEQCGVIIPLAGDVDYRQFAGELRDHNFAPDDLVETDVRSRSPFSRP